MLAFLTMKTCEGLSDGRTETIPAFRFCGARAAVSKHPPAAGTGNPEGITVGACVSIRRTSVVVGRQCHFNRDA